MDRLCDGDDDIFDFFVDRELWTSGNVNNVGFSPRDNILRDNGSQHPCCHGFVLAYDADPTGGLAFDSL